MAASRIPGFNARTSLPIRVFNSIINPHHQLCVRYLHKSRKPAAVPLPTPFVPDVETFLRLIGRNMSRYSSKITGWKQLFTADSAEFRELGIEMTRDRRYIMRWREKFRQQDYGPGGDLENVVDGVAELRAVEVPIESAKDAQSGKAANTDEKPLDVASMGTATLSPGMRYAIVNLPPGETELKDPSKPLKKFAHYKLHHGNMIKGPYAQIIPNTWSTAVKVQVTDGMWEHKRGRKIDGGQRRQKEIRAKRALAERRKAAA
ncbi:telomere length regulation protein [Microsporum ferrugineum]